MYLWKLLSDTFQTSEEPRLIDINLSQPSVEVNYSVNPGTVYYVKVTQYLLTLRFVKFSYRNYHE